MMKLKAAIIDDEVHCIETLAYDLQEVYGDKIDIIFTAKDSVEGIKQIGKTRPDLLFLDIEMPRLNGFDVLELIEGTATKVIFTTAHSEYAIRAVGLKAAAYLLKPIQPEDLQEALDRVYKTFLPPENTTLRRKLPIPYADGIQLIAHTDILYCQSSGNYTEFFLTTNEKIVASKTLKYFGELLPNDQFVRIHKSYIVNLLHLKRYLKVDGGIVCMSNNVNLPVSRINREKLLKLIHPDT